MWLWDLLRKLITPRSRAGSLIRVERLPRYRLDGVLMRLIRETETTEVRPLILDCERVAELSPGETLMIRTLIMRLAIVDVPLVISGAGNSLRADFLDCGLHRRSFYPDVESAKEALVGVITG